jgi:predicted methyltransferase MtxX (methanogen marker protein 4)
MTAKEYLNGVRNQNYVLKQAEKELNALRGDIISIHAGSLSEKVSGTKESDLADTYIRVEKYERRVTSEWNKLIDMRMQAKAMIAALADEREQAVLYARYINCLGWEIIALDMHYSWRGVFKLHGKALKSFERVHGSALHK